MDSITKYSMLTLCFLLHWIMVILFATYAFIFDKTYDGVYITLWILLILHWIILNDCYISKIEKQFIYGSLEQVPPFSNPSIQFYTGSNIFTWIVALVIFIMFTVNAYIVLRRNNVPFWIVVLCCISIAFIPVVIRVMEAIYIYKKNKCGFCLS